MELLDERWTLLIVREMVTGSQRFNELRRGLPGMSPSLLSKRLNHLMRAGIVERVDEVPFAAYVLTDAGRELGPVVEALGVWGVRWVGVLGEDDLDPKLLLWDMHRNVDHTRLPQGRTVVHFQFSDLPARTRDWWLVLTSTDADVCDVDPGYDVSVTVLASIRGLVEVWRGDSSWSAALGSGTIAMQGPSALRRALPGWFTLSAFASVGRPVGAALPIPTVGTTADVAVI